MESFDRRALEVRLEAAVEADDWHRVYEIFDESWIELFQSSPDVLLLALERMPDDVLDRQPKLRLAREYIARNVRGDEHSTTYRHSVASFVPVDVVDRLALITGQAAAARSAGRAAESLRLVASAQELLRVQPIGSHPEIAEALPEFHYQWGLTLERAGELEGALTEYVEGFDWSVSVGHQMMQAASGGAIAYLHAVHGRIAAAQGWLDRQPRTGAEAWWRSSMAVQARLAEGLVRAARPDSRGPDPLEGLRTADVMKHWAPYFFVRATALRSARTARLLRIELDGFLATLPVGQRTDQVSADYLETTRLIISACADELGVVDDDDERPSATAPVLRQHSAAVRALHLARAGRTRQALQLAEPLLRADGSRPRILVLALIASAIATSGDRRRRSLLSEAVAIARSHDLWSPFHSLPDALRVEARDLFDALGAGEAPSVLRSSDHAPSAGPVVALTRRERAVVEHAVEGESTAEIAAALLVSVNTVKSQLRSAYRKVGVTSRSELRDVYRGAAGE